jgi:AcrR family transcriptional regulator
MYRILNMRSAPGLDSLPDDRTTKARIRDAAIDCIAEAGVRDTTVRMVAAAAGVSPGLVMHHFGSMDGLRTACDEHVTSSIRQVKEGAMAAGPGLDVLGIMRETKIGPAARYVARMLAEDSPAVERLVDDLVSDAEQYLERGVESGLLRPSGDPRGRAAVLALWSLGAIALHRHMERILGVDLTDPDVLSGPAIAAYMGPAYEILGTGIFTEEAADSLRAATDAIRDLDTSPPSEPDPTKGTR